MKQTKKLSVVFTKEQYAKLRKLAFDKEWSMAQMLRELLKKIL